MMLIVVCLISAVSSSPVRLPLVGLLFSLAHRMLYCFSNRRKSKSKEKKIENNYHLLLCIFFVFKTISETRQFFALLSAQHSGHFALIRLDLCAFRMVFRLCNAHVCFSASREMQVQWHG